MSQRYLPIECVICRRAFPIKYATAIPRVTCGKRTHEIAAYVCDSRKCFLRASWETLSPNISHATKEAS